MPRMPIQIGSHAGAQPFTQGVGGIEANQHLVRDLRIARLVGANEAETISAQQRKNSIKDEKHAADHEDRCFRRSCPARQSEASAFRRFRCNCFQLSLHVQQISKPVSERISRFNRIRRIRVKPAFRPAPGIGEFQGPGKGLHASRSKAKHRKQTEFQTEVRLTDSHPFRTGSPPEACGVTALENHFH